MPATATRRQRERTPMTEEERAAWKAAKAARLANLETVRHEAATELLNDPDAVEAFRDAVASIGAGDYDGATYTLRNALLMWSQNRAITHVGSLGYWQQHGRKVRKGAKALGIFVYIDRKKADEDDEDKPSTEDGQPKKRRPKYKVANGTFDVADTIPTRDCPHCGTPAPADPAAQGCPTTCPVFKLRPGRRPSTQEVLELAAALVEEDETDE